MNLKLNSYISVQALFIIAMLMKVIFLWRAFFKRNNEFFEQYKDDLQDIEHPVYLKMFYENLYHNKAYDFGLTIFDGGEIFDELKEKIILDDDDQAQKRPYTRKNKNDKPINRKSSREYKKKIYATQEDKINDWIVTQKIYTKKISGFQNQPSMICIYY